MAPLRSKLKCFVFCCRTGAWPGYQGRRQLLFIRDGDDQSLLLNKTSHQPHLLDIFPSRYNLLTQIFLTGVEGHKSPMLSIEFVKWTGRSKNSEKFRALWPAENWHFYWPIRAFYIHKPGLPACIQWGQGKGRKGYQISFIQQHISCK